MRRVSPADADNTAVANGFLQGSSAEQHGLAEDGGVCDLHVNKSWPIEEEYDLSWTAERLEPACDSAIVDEPTE